MKKQELIHLHGLLAEVSNHAETHHGVTPELDRYESLGVRPTSIHKSKTDHKEAVFALAEAITGPMDREPGSNETEEHYDFQSGELEEVSQISELGDDKFQTMMEHVADLGAEFDRELLLKDLTNRNRWRAFLTQQTGPCRGEGRGSPDLEQKGLLEDITDSNRFSWSALLEKCPRQGTKRHRTYCALSILGQERGREVEMPFGTHIELEKSDIYDAIDWSGNRYDVVQRVNDLFQEGYIGASKEGDEWPRNSVFLRKSSALGEIRKFDDWEDLGDYVFPDGVEVCDESGLRKAYNQAAAT